MAVTAAAVARIWKRLSQPGGAEEPETAVLQASRPGVIITIAREHGSAGKRMGQLAAQRLNIPCCYKEMTALAAQQSGLSKDFRVRKVMEMYGDRPQEGRKSIARSDAARKRPPP